jgi:hypothetical protein
MLAVDDEPEATLRVKSSPEPERATVCRLALALSATLSVPERLPAAVGVNFTLMVQLALPASELPQLSVCAKSPLVLILEMVSTALLVFVSVTVCAVLVAPTSTLEKLRLAGDTLAVGKLPAP